MKKLLISFVGILSLIIFSCTKDENGYGDKTFYGSISVSQVPVTDAVDLDVYFGEKKLGTILASGTLVGFTVEANTTGKLAVYKKGSDTLVADTTMAIPPNNAVSFKVISSETLGASGFIDGGTVGADSVKVQLINSLNTTLYPFPNGVDVCIYTYASNQIADSVMTIKNVMPGKLDPRVIVLRHVDPLGKGIFYVARLRDPATGQFIRQTASNVNMFLFLNTSAGYNGHLNLIQYYDNGGDVTSNKILVKVTTL